MYDSGNMEQGHKTYENTFELVLHISKAWSLKFCNILRLSFLCTLAV